MSSISQGGIDPDAPGLTGRIGGPLGKHAGISGVWFDPVPWSIGAGIVAWVLCMLRQVRCLSSDPSQIPNAFSSLCYSDISVLYQARGNFWSGSPLYSGQQPLEYPPLSGGFIWIARWLTAHLGGQVSPVVDATQRLHAANIFFAVNAVMLFICFMALIWAHLEMGRHSAAPHTDGMRTRAWDAILIAASPLVMASGLINWDMLAVALTALGLLAWARKRPALAGVAIGLACAAKFYPMALLAVLFVLCIRSSKMRAYATMFATAVVAWLAANLPVMLTNKLGWEQFYSFNVDRGGDLGSIWYVLDLMGLNVPGVNILEIVLLFACGAGIIVLALAAPRRPRVGQIGLLVMVAFLVFNKVYSPQYVLWLLPFVVLARPKILDLAVFTVSELAYYFAIWGFLDGVMGPGSGPDRLYWLSVAVRVGVQIWIAVRVIDDVLHPWQDPVRGPFVDDPIGGVLDHAPDAPFMLREARAPRPLVAPDQAGATLRSEQPDEPAEVSDGVPDSKAPARVADDEPAAEVVAAHRMEDASEPDESAPEVPDESSLDESEPDESEPDEDEIGNPSSWDEYEALMASIDGILTSDPVPGDSARPEPDDTPDDDSVDGDSADDR